METLVEILNENTKKKIISRCGSKPDRQGLMCPYCGAREVYADKNEPRNTDKRFWMIKAFRVDDYSHCLNCDKWFKL